MGQKVCKTQKFQNEDPLAFNFGADDRETGVLHGEQIACSNKEIQKILSNYAQNLKTEKTLFKDPNMLSEPIILKSKFNEIHCSYQRPYKFLSGVTKGQSYKLIDYHDSQPSYIEVRDQVMQYFGVFLCFLADKPTEIQKIISTGENSYGVQCIEAYRNGKVINFLVDDYILCRETNGTIQPVFSQPQKNMYMWPCILEKAWFKIRGNAAKKVEQNSPQQVFETFLPLPIQKIYLKDGLNFTSRQSLNKYFTGFQQGYPKDKGFICRSKKNTLTQIGLSGGCYFYLLDTFIHENKRLFYLRNPCSSNMSFRGTYGKISPQLQDLLYKRKFIHNVAGNFVVDEEEFVEQMGQLHIVHYIPGNKITSYCFQCDNEQQFFLSFDLKYKGTFNLGLVQSYQGGPSSKSRSYAPFTYHVVRLADMRLLGGEENREGCFGVKNTYLLDRFNQDSGASKYLVRLKKKFYQQPVGGALQMFLIGYSMENIKFQIAGQDEMEQKWKDFLKIEGARQLNISDQNRNTKSLQIAHKVCWLGDIAYIYIQKRSKKEQISIQVNFPELMNLQCISHPEIRRSDQWHSYKVKDKLLIIFQKISLTAETHIRQYHIQAY